jgi:hypothetical protein
MGKDWFIRAIFPCSETLVLVRSAVWLKVTDDYSIKRIESTEAEVILKKFGYKNPPSEGEPNFNSNISGVIDV